MIKGRRRLGDLIVEKGSPVRAATEAKMKARKMMKMAEGCGSFLRIK